MSTRALRKLHGGQDLSDLTPEFNGASVSNSNSGSGSDQGPTENQPVKSKKNKKKKKGATSAAPANLFDLLDEEDQKNDDDPSAELSPDQMSDNNKDAQDTTQTTGAKKKKKKKKKKKNSEKLDTAGEQEDEIDASIREVNRLLGDMPTRGQVTSLNPTNAGSGASCRALLSIEHRFLNPDNEMRRIFGSNVVQANHDRNQNRRMRNNRATRKGTWLVQPHNNWPHMGKTGLSMSLVETTSKAQLFKFEHNREYQKVQFLFLEAVESLDAQNIISVLNAHPHHIDSLLQVSEICKMSEDAQMAAEFVERAMYTCECAFHPSFSLTQGNARLDYRIQENRAFFIALFRHLIVVGKKGCYRTALEFCKLLLSLDPEADPLCVLLMIDFYALRASENNFLVQLYHEWEAHRNLSQLPNFAFSVPLAMFTIATEAESSLDEADQLLQGALLMFPGLLMPLLDHCSIAPDAQVSAHSFFGAAAQYGQAKALEQLIALYIGRTSSCWKEAGVVAWLERNVRVVMATVDREDPIVNDYATKRKSRYQGTPRNVHRHIMMSEIKEATAVLPPDMASAPVMSYDPLPPTDSVAAYTRPERQSRLPDSSPLSMFFQSLLPNFNPQEVPLETPAAGAVGGEGQGEGQHFRQGVMQVMNAMRDLLNNIQPAPLPVENQHQGEEGGEGEGGEWD